MSDRKLINYLFTEEKMFKALVNDFNDFLDETTIRNAIRLQRTIELIIDACKDSIDDPVEAHSVQGSFKSLQLGLDILSLYIDDNKMPSYRKEVLSETRDYIKILKSRFKKYKQSEF